MGLRTRGGFAWYVSTDILTRAAILSALGLGRTLDAGGGNDKPVRPDIGGTELEVTGYALQGAGDAIRRKSLACVWREERRAVRYTPGARNPPNFPGQ